MVVRPASPHDLAEIARVHVTSAAAAYGSLVDDSPESLERRCRTWAALLGDPGRAPFVAEADGEIVGVLNVGPNAEDGSTGELHLLYVHPDRWGSGGGQQLIERGHEELARRFDTATLTVVAGNPRARRFYERNGWRLEATVVEPHFGGHPTEVARYIRDFRR